MRNMIRFCTILFFVLMTASLLPTAKAAQSVDATQTPSRDSSIIGPGDTLHIQVLDTPDMDQHPRVTDAGNIPVLGVGKMSVTGLTPAQTADKIRDGLIAAHYMNHPEVMVTVDQYATQTVSVLGQVKLPGAYAISTSRSVLDVVAMAGGLTDTADRHITVERRGNKLHPIYYNLSNDSDAALSQTVMVYPGDTVLIPKAGIAYVLGDVGHPGGFVMQNNHSQLTVLQAVAMAGGTQRSAVPSKAKLIRKTPQGYKEIPVQLSAMQKGKKADMAMMPDDVLYVPFSYLRNIAVGASGIVAAASSAAVFAAP